MVVVVPLPRVSIALGKAVGDRHGSQLLLNGGEPLGPAGRNCDYAGSWTSLASASRMHLDELEFIPLAAVLDTGVDVCDVQIAARHADPCTSLHGDALQPSPEEPRPAPSHVLVSDSPSGTPARLVRDEAGHGGRTRVIDMAAPSEDKLYTTTLQTIGAVSKLPIVRVDREVFLRKHFGDSEHLDVILDRGPQAVYSLDSLRKKASSLINSSAARTSMLSFASGLPANPAVMIPAGGADVAQYFGFAINLAQQIAYLFGEDDLFDGGGQLSEPAQVRVIAYLGAMFGAAGASALVANTSKIAGANLGKKIAAQALTKTAWYPLLKKVGAAIGVKITKKTVEKTITKSVPVIGGVVSGALTYVTFRPMGHRLADTLVRNLSGDFDEELVLNSQFATSASALVVEAETFTDESTA